jgi:ligand-binding sensor domain-containing protein
MYSQQLHIPYINYTSENGLPSDQVYQCIQDREGFMWFVTDNGISKFDGYTFKNYGAKEGLTQPVIFNIQEDKFGRILCTGLNREFFIIDKKIDKVVEIKSVSKLFEKSKSYKLDFYFDDDLEQLIIKEYAGQKLYILDKHFNIVSEKATDVPTVYVNKNFVTTYGPQFRNNEKKLIPVENSKFEIVKKFTLPKLIDNFYLYYKSENLMLITDSKRNIIFDSELNAICLPKKVYNYINSNGVILAGLSNSKGLISASSYKKLLDQQYDLLIPNIEITYIYYDQNQNIWCCTLNNGVYLLQSLYNLQYNINSEEKYKNICIDTPEEILLISKSGKLFKSNLGNLTKLNIDAKVTKVGKNKKHTLIVKNNLLYGQIGSNFRQFVMKSGVFYFALNSFVFDPYNENRVYCISSARMMYYDLLKRKLIWYGDNFRNLDLNFNNEGELLVSNVNGLGYLKNKKIYLYDKLGSFPNQRIDFIRKLSNGIIILGSKTNGLFIKENNNFYNFTVVDGLSSDNINCIKIDAKDNIWLGTNKGMERIRYLGSGKVAIDHITECQGLQSNIVIDIDYDKKKDRIYAVNLDGLFIFDCINGLNPTKQIYPTSIESLLINNKESRAIDDMHLPYDSNNLTFTLISKQFILNGKIPYQFKLNSGSWEDLGTNRIINLMALNPGKYGLQFRSKNENGLWNKPSIFNFTILLPWYQNSIFYLLVLTSFSIGFYLFYRRRVKIIKKENELKEEIVNLERVALQAQMNPHFIFNSLNSIQNYILNNDKVEASEYLSKFAALVRTNLYYSNKSKIALSDEINMLKNYLELEKMRFKDKFEYSVSFKKEFSRPLNEIYLSPMLIQPIIENSIKHGISEDKKFGLINVVFEDSADFIIVTVEDDGPGLVEKKDSKDNFSMGTSITSKRIQLLSKGLKDGFILRNRYNENCEVIGTEAILKINVIQE